MTNLVAVSLFQGRVSVMGLLPNNDQTAGVL